LQGLCSKPLVIKWPNDLLVVVSEGERAKLAGILVEYLDMRAIVGIGVNTLRPSDFAASGQDVNASPTIYLSDCLVPGGTISREAVTAALLIELQKILSKWRENQHSFAPFQQDYQELLDQLGKDIEVHDAYGSRVAVGQVRGIDTSGLLLVSTPSGITKVAAGEVTLRRE
jgi:biotin-(acetyl-CoA carboxylase) ligase